MTGPGVMPEVRALSQADKHVLLELAKLAGVDASPTVLDTIIELLCQGVKARDLAGILRSFKLGPSLAGRAAA